MLVDHEIIKAYTDGKIGISPFNSEQINPNSYDVTLSDQFYPMDFQGLIDPREPMPIGNTYTMDTFVIKPQEHVLATTIEDIALCNGYAAMLNGKSSWGRLGITIHQTAGFIDSGFNGQLTLEIFNVNKNASVILRKGDRIGQLIFFKVSECDIPYDELLSSKYSNQQGVVISRYYKGFEHGL